MKLGRYEVNYYNTRNDGRVEPAGVERRVLTREEALELSFSAVVVSLDAEGFGGAKTAIVNGKSLQLSGRHMPYDPHLNTY